jgi:hypothetical protein
VRISKLAILKEDSIILDQQLKSLTIRFVLTPGATVSDDGLHRDFTQPQTYTVTSEDGRWQKDYEVSFFTARFDKKEYDFSHYRLFETSTKKNYYEFYELIDEIPDEEFNVWASGNGGYALTAKVSDPPESYPTFAITTPQGEKGVKLVTRSTGALGALVGMPIAAGNLFLGSFEISSAMTKPLEATQFGVQTTQTKPDALGLWCKYKAGQEYKDRYGTVLSLTDYPEIYAVLYEPKIDSNGNPVKLNGTNIQKADNIVSIAISGKEHVDQIIVKDIDQNEYKYIEIPFKDRQRFEPEKQFAGKYYITIVFSSGAKGDLFEGAVGSTLCVDEVRLIEKD